jgi:phosphate transport system substrate-binding protein
MFKKINSIIVTLVILLVAVGCGPKKEAKNFATDSPSFGTINISVDETFKPVIEEQIKVYEASYPGTTIIAHYKSEADCFKDLLNDTANRMVIVTRGLTSKESRFYTDSLNYTPVSNKLASDAIAVIINKNNPDSLFTLLSLQNLLEGKMGKNKQIVFDGLNATSTVRFAVDSILHGASFDTSVVKAKKNSEAVIQYIAENKDAIGLVGISWVGNPEDVLQTEMLKKIKIAYVKCNTCLDTPYIKPTPQSMLTRRYPLVRGLYYIVKENFSGLGSGFAEFLNYERGQMIFRRAYLAPKMDFEIRTITLSK